MVPSPYYLSLAELRTKHPGDSRPGVFCYLTNFRISIEMDGDLRTVL